jgi:hypothetical protein
VQDATATSFPLSKHTRGGDTAPVFPSLHVYLQFTWEVGLPPSPVEFSSNRHFYKLSRSWLLGSATAAAFSGWLVYLQLTWEVVFPPLLWSFPPMATFTSFPPPGFWVCAAAPSFSSWLVRDFPFLPLWHSGCPALFAMCLFCCYCLLFSFSFFPWVGIDLTRGLC